MKLGYLKLYEKLIYFAVKLVGESFTKSILS